MRLRPAQRDFLWDAARPIGKHASATNPTGISLEERGLVVMAAIVSPARHIGLWVATEAGREHPAAKEKAA